MLSDAQSALEQQLGYKLESHKKTEWISVGKSAMLFLSAPIISVESVGNYEVKRYQKNILYLTDKVKGEVDHGKSKTITGFDFLWFTLYVIAAFLFIL